MYENKILSKDLMNLWLAIFSELWLGKAMVATKVLKQNYKINNSHK